MLVHWERCLQGLEISATEPALADSDNRDCGPGQPLRNHSLWQQDIGPDSAPARARTQAAVFESQSLIDSVSESLTDSDKHWGSSAASGQLTLKTIRIELLQTTFCTGAARHWPRPFRRWQATVIMLATHHWRQDHDRDLRIRGQTLPVLYPARSPTRCADAFKLQLPRALARPQVGPGRPRRRRGSGHSVAPSLELGASS